MILDMIVKIFANNVTATGKPGMQTREVITSHKS
jgi:hypothetical protein